MHSGSRRRAVLSCVPCYTKKQKCDRRYPCNNCSRRRQPENCVYNTSAGAVRPSSQGEGRSVDEAPVSYDVHSQDEDDPGEDPFGKTSRSTSQKADQEANSLAALFGYVEHSQSNTLALIRRLEANTSTTRYGECGFPPAILREIEKQLEGLPHREILDFLIQYYVREVHWMEQVVYAPWFLDQYQQWWASGRQKSTVFDVEFTVLFLRICLYASQFLPSPSHTIDRIRSVLLDDIRDACYDVSEKLAAICASVEPRGALLRVQHLAVLGFQWQCRGNIDKCWDVLGSAVRVAQRIGLHRGRSAWLHGMHEFDKEIRCRVFCSLYVWDSLVSRQIDLPPLLSTALTEQHLPYMHLSPSGGETDEPEAFSERILQARLAHFWRCLGPIQARPYEPTVAEERYEKFRSEYLTPLLSAFALQPCRQWDERLQWLPLQRMTLHIAIFESLCHNFRPVLLCEPQDIRVLPAYKQVLIASHRRALAAAALKVLENVSKLHALLGRSHTRLTTIILPSFEAAVVLVSLTRDAQFPGIEQQPSHTHDFDPLGEERVRLSRDRCHQAVHEASARLGMLAEVSNLAKTSMITLTRLIMRSPNPITDVQTSSLESLDIKTLHELIAWCSTERSPSATDALFTASPFSPTQMGA